LSIRKEKDRGGTKREGTTNLTHRKIANENNDKPNHKRCSNLHLLFCVFISEWPDSGVNLLFYKGDFHKGICYGQEKTINSNNNNKNQNKQVAITVW